MVTISVEEYKDAVDSYSGFCTTCEYFSTLECEPDAENYCCDDCGLDTVFGAENALVLGLFDIVE